MFTWIRYTNEMLQQFPNTTMKSFSTISLAPGPLLVGAMLLFLHKSVSIITSSVRGAWRFFFGVSWDFVEGGGGGVWPNPNFLSKLTKPNLPHLRTLRVCLSLNCIRIVPPNPRGDDVSLYYHLFLDWGYNMDTIVYQLFSTVCGVFEGLPVRNILKVWSFHKNPHPQSVVLEGTSKNAQCPSFTLLSFFLPNLAQETGKIWIWKPKFGLKKGAF